MTDQRLRELFEERVADLPRVDAVDAAWRAAGGVRRRRRAVAGTVAAVVAVVGAATVVAVQNGDAPPPPPPAKSDEADEGLTLERTGTYGGADVWWGPTKEQEAGLPAMSVPRFPGELDLDDVAGELPAGTVVAALAQVSGDERVPGTTPVLAVATDGTTYEIENPPVPQGDLDVKWPLPVTQESLAPDGRHAFFVYDKQTLMVLDFMSGEWTQVAVGGTVPEHATWKDARTIKIPKVAAFDPDFILFSPDGQRIGSSAEIDLIAHLNDRDEGYGPTRGDARAFLFAGPITGPGGAAYRSTDGVLVRDGDTANLLTFGIPDDGRWLQCCAVVGWADPATVMVQSRGNTSRILGWRYSTGELFRIADITGWTPGEESWTASFADPAQTEIDEDRVTPDAVVDDVPVWWSPSLADERELSWLEDSPLPRELDVQAALQIAPELTPGSDAPPAIAAFPSPGPQDPTAILLLAADGSVRRLDVGAELESYRTRAAPFDLANRSMLSPDGRHLAFPQRAEMAIVDVTTGEWSRFDAQDPTPYFAWADDTHLFLAAESEVEGGLYDITTGQRVGDAGAGNGVLWTTERARRTEAPWKVGPNGLVAQPGLGGPQVPVPGEGDGRFVSGPRYVAITGEQRAALALVEEVDDTRASEVWGAVVAGWLDEDTLVYESGSQDEYTLIAWTVGTHEFRRVLTIEPPGIQTFFGGPSFADLTSGNG